MVRVSVVIPAYNCCGTIREAIESVLAQDVDNVESIVVDDGSIDSTPHVLENYKSSITAIRQANAGAAAARNVGVSAASGKYLAFLDADDVWLPGRLRRTLDALEGNPEAVLSFSDYLFADHSLEILHRSCAGRAPSHQDLLGRSWAILPSAVTVRRSALEKAGGFCEEFKGCGGEDPYMWLVLSEFGPFEYIPEPLMIHRSGASRTVIEKYEAGRQTFVRLVRSRYGNAAEGCIRESREYFAHMFLAGALEELDRGNLARAVYLLCRVVYYRPFFFFDPKLARKLLSARNAKRLVTGLFTSPLCRR